MVAARRFGPLIVAVAVGMLVLLVRMYQVQVGEHATWAKEAANLTRSATVMPYLRGKITDRHGEVLVEDEVGYAVQFTYREFRRNHPLGQVCHARSALEDRGIAVGEAVRHFEEWGMALVSSTAGEVEAFARGEAVRLCGIDFPAVSPGEDRRRTRAGELRFYTHGLLDVSLRSWNRVKKLLKSRESKRRSWIELVAQVEGSSAERVRERVAHRLEVCLPRLEQLAWQLGVLDEDEAPAATPFAAFWQLIDALERKRQEIENAIATDLFLEATGFHPGRVESAALLEAIDVEWVGERFGWDRARAEEWARDVREQWLEDRRSYHVPAAQVRTRLRIREGGESVFDALLGELAVLYARRPRTPSEWRERSREWRRIDSTAAFAELSDLFEELDGAVAGVSPTPHRDAAVLALLRRGADELARLEGIVPFEHAEAVLAARPEEVVLDWRGEPLDPWSPPASAAEAAERLERVFGANASSRSTWRDGEELLPWLVELWESHFQVELRVALEALLSRASREGLAVPLAISAGRLKRAEKKADYSTRDRSSRSEIVDEDPVDAVVLLLTRHGDEFSGFKILERTRRRARAFDSDEVLVARELIGVVRESSLEEMVEQQAERQKLSRIIRKRTRTEADQEEVEGLVAELFRNDEVHGTSGLEGLLDPVLRGENGFKEDEGLQQRHGETGRGLFRSRSRLFVEKVDGKDVALTLDVDLQNAAQAVIENPFLPNAEQRRDKVWFRSPVGAIVLATVDGEVLAAASGPKQSREVIAERDGERAYHYDRTLHRRRFQPVGSIFKPFVAAYALERAGLDPGRVFSCEPRTEQGTAGWGKVACWNQWGHHEMTLVPAIEQSCNAYFAQVGELLETRERVLEVSRLFGFDLPTGVSRACPGWGLGEDYQIPRLHEDSELTPTELHRAGNGLEVIEATPVQVARAVAGLATGRLPAMSLVRSIGGEELPLSSEAILLSRESLELVRAAMRGVVERGSASGKGLSAAELGFTLAAKTGSADYRVMSDAYRAQLRLLDDSHPQMRKHTWFVGFFPYEDPQAVVVVYCHDIGVTAAHSAVHLGAQFLKSPAVQAFAQGALR